MEDKVPGSNNQLEVVQRGELESISKPPSANLRPGSRPSQTASASTTSTRATHSSIAASLQLLHPEEVMEEDLDMELEEYGSSDEYTEDDYSDSELMTTGRTSEIFRIPDPDSAKQRTALQYERERLQQQRLLEEQQQQQQAQHNDYFATRQLALLGGSPGQSDVDSEEEQDIIRDIKKEITEKVKEEMKEELSVYKEARERLQHDDDSKHKANHSDLDHLEPKLKEAFLQMRKLDRILQRKIKKEKTVKRERLVLQKRLREELAGIKPEGHDESRELKTNTDRFLALTLPPSHNAGISVENPEESPPGTPLFATQVPDDFLNHANKEEDKKENNDGAQRRGSTQASTSRTNDTDSTVGGSTTIGSTMTGSTTTMGGTKKKRKKKKDFIKRNKELAADADNPIAMTDDEKERVNDLLADLEGLAEIPEDNMNAIETEENEVNPFALVAKPGEGFTPEQLENRRLQDIDNQLKALLPPEDFEAIATTPHSLTSKGTLFTRTALRNVDLDEDLPGEQALKDTKEHRDMHIRLKDIEQELDNLTSAVEHEIASPTLSDSQLQNLLDECARTMTRCTAETDSIASSSRSTVSRASLYENPPRLSEEVLQALLAEARQSMAGSNAPSLTSGRSSAGDEVPMESISEEKLQELLRDSRATSSASIRSNSRAQEMEMPASYSTGNMNDQSYRPSVSHQPPAYSSSSPVLERAPVRRPFLPEIDHRGSLVNSQASYRINNEESGDRSSRLGRLTIHNNISDHHATDDSKLAMASYESNWSMEEVSFTSNTPTPHPPTSGRRSSSSRNRNESTHLKSGPS